jgi:hypothetical protein
MRAFRLPPTPVVEASGRLRQFVRVETAPNGDDER